MGPTDLAERKPKHECNGSLHRHLGPQPYPHSALDGERHRTSPRVPVLVCRMVARRHQTCVRIFDCGFDMTTSLLVLPPMGRARQEANGSHFLSGTIWQIRSEEH